MNNREIKFRMWLQEDEDSEGEMIYLDQHLQRFDYENGWVLSFTNYSEFWGHECYTNNKPFKYELMQFTGLKDKNGYDIYEGDIVKCNQSDCHLREDLKSGVIGKIKFDEQTCAFIVRYKDKEDDDYICNTDCEVIGNIFENE